MKISYVYILKCSDDSYYTGITSNLTERITEHKIGKYKDTIHILEDQFNLFFMQNLQILL